MKIARYLFGHLFRCTFDYLWLTNTIINQEMVELLFDENKTNNLPLQIHCRKLMFSFGHGDMEQFLNFIYNYLIADEVSIDIGRNAEPKIINLFERITTTQDKFGCVSVTRLSLLHQNLYDFITQVILINS
ncbi:unnamed protein product [Meloidogyne enterolobii]|uniref:Uncharacterized protein n=1 Tax=Meloidogyne enterolobii TaxID=390850 RepID=A0ACB1B3I4_MELEN